MYVSFAQNCSATVVGAAVAVIIAGIYLAVAGVGIQQGLPYLRRKCRQPWPV